VGGGIEVADGWINVDGSVHAVAAGLPRPVLSALYARTRSVREHMSKDEYVRRLRGHRFVFHDLGYGLPFEDNVADFIFCSHVLEHFARHDAARLVREMWRVLKPGGRARVTVPDLARAFDLYARGAREAALEYFFTNGRAGSYDQHRYMYDFELLRTLLASAGFADITRCGYREGATPDLERLDNRPGQTLFVEAVKHA
jgi:SAM-dependent methyltransferase